MLDESKQHTRTIFIDQRSGAHGPGALMETYITKGTVKRQNSMKEDSGVKEQYSKDKHIRKDMPTLYNS